MNKAPTATHQWERNMRQNTRLHINDHVKLQLKPYMFVLRDDQEVAQQPSLLMLHVGRWERLRAPGQIELQPLFSESSVHHYE